MKLLIFSDIHSNHQALERLMALEADYYFAAGDLVNWGRGLEACGKILNQRAGKVYVLPGNHESEAQIATFCAQFGFQNFHGQTLANWQISHRRIGLLQPYAVPHPRRVQRS